MLELIRKHSWSMEKRSLLYKYIELRPNHVVVDVGCGTGAFSRVIAQGLSIKRGGRIIGIDRNGELLKTARKLGDDAGLAGLISFKKGDATKMIPLPDNFADRVVCQAFLWLFTERQREKVIREMIRICKPKGVIGAVEGAIDSSITYIEESNRLTELWKKHNLALLDGYRKIYGYDRRIGYKLPMVFKRLGLKRIRLDGVSDVRLQLDERIHIEDRINWTRYELEYPKSFLLKIDRLRSPQEKKLFVERMEQVLIAGGMTAEEIIEFVRLRKSHGESLLRKTELFGKDASVQAGTHFLTTGVKL